MAGTAEHDPPPPAPTDVSNGDGDYPSVPPESPLAVPPPGSDGGYHDPSSNDLTLVSGALLLTADCVGTGILALPADVQNLGRGWGIAFLLLNLPVNLYAGTILCRCALYAEGRMLGGVGESAGWEEEGGEEGRNCHGQGFDRDKNGNEEKATDEEKGNGRGKKRRSGYSSVDVHDASGGEISEAEGNEGAQNDASYGTEKHPQHTNIATFDFVGMSSMLFDAPIPPTAAETFVSESVDPDPDADCGDDEDGDHGRLHRPISYGHPFTRVVLVVYYVNLFLVLGNYILVMSHAVSAMAGENNLCIPTAGIIASTLMFALSQLQTMAHLGRGVSAASLVALLILVVQCLHSLRRMGGEDGANDFVEELEEYASFTPAEAALARMSSLAAIGFSIGSQKLLLNIRHEMADRTAAAPGVLSTSLSIYGLAYVVVCLLAGPQPPSFLFDAIPPGTGRRVAGFLLWGHVAVSYAINSQAFCSSVDRVVGHRVKFWGLGGRHKLRWGIITALVALTSYLVANAIPFFKDLVALCGAATSIPLTLLIPAIFYRRVQGVPICFPTLHSKYSFALMAFSVLFMVMGLVGAIGSIDVDWLNTSGPFACH